jgi:hypothetical protein
VEISDEERASGCSFSSPQDAPITVTLSTDHTDPIQRR